MSSDQLSTQAIYVFNRPLSTYQKQINSFYHRKQHFIVLSLKSRIGTMSVLVSSGIWEPSRDRSLRTVRWPTCGYQEHSQQAVQVSVWKADVSKGSGWELGPGSWAGGLWLWANRLCLDQKCSYCDVIPSSCSGLCSLESQANTVSV